MIEDCKETPLTDLLGDVPYDARMIYEHSETESRNIQVGKLCAAAYAEIIRLKEQLREARQQSQSVRDALEKAAQAITERLCIEDITPQEAGELVLSFIEPLSQASNSVAVQEPVAYFEAQESTRGMPFEKVFFSMLYSTMWHKQKPKTTNPVWEICANPAPTLDKE